MSSTPTRSRLSTDVTDATAGRRLTLLTLAGAAGGAMLVLACAAWGTWLSARGAQLHLGGAAPLAGHWDPRISPRVLAPVLVAALIIGWGPAWAARLPWRRLVAAAPLAAAGWAVSLAASDGWAALGTPLTAPTDYLHDVPRVGALRRFLDTFLDYVVASPNGPQWTTHVGGHPPGALLAFVLLERSGLGGAGWAAAVCIGAGASAVAAVLLTVRTLGGEAVARRAAPYLVLAPAALWIATSADALFLGVTAWGVCALAISASGSVLLVGGDHAGRGHPGHAASRWRVGRLRADLIALVGGGLLGVSLFLSYGLVLMGVIAFSVVAACRRVRPLVIGCLGVVAVVAAFVAEGFWWFDGLVAATARVRQGAAWIERPTSYFLVANLAALAVAVGPATAGAFARIGAALGKRAATRLGPALALPAGAAAAVLLASASNLSKGEVERIYLPFALWLMTATAALPVRQQRGWLAAQATVAIGLQIALASTW